MSPADLPDTLLPRGNRAKRSTVLQAAAAVFYREGYSGANIDLIAAEAGVSRQTIYNHHSDKETLFRAVLYDLTERVNEVIFETLATFPDHPVDLEEELVGFAVRFNQIWQGNQHGSCIRKLIETEGERYPELFAGWREKGPGLIWSAVGARFARLARAGHLDIADPDLAARQFLALVSADIRMATALGDRIDEATHVQAARNGVRTFLRAFGSANARQRNSRSATPAR
jgi:AcrR family transcriptional regulator